MVPTSRPSPLAFLLLAATTGLTGCASEAPLRTAEALAPAQVEDAACDPEYAAEFADWRSTREASLRNPEGYLGLAGLSWLRDGSNVLGSDPTCDLVLPEGRAPARVGVITWREGRARFIVEPGVYVTTDGQAVADIDLQTDAGGRATVCRVGELSFQLIDRVGQVGLRLRDPQSPVLAEYQGTDTWAPRNAWRLNARFVPPAMPSIVAIPNVLGSSYEETAVGTLEFEVDGELHELTVTGRSGENLFVIFGDAGNGLGSYGGGRFLRVGAPDDLGRTVIDFNRSYNPPCAYSPYTTCPLPPEGNVLPFAVTAGEKLAHD
jgi:uncharacterized protein (DUF1684 family)